MLIIELNRTNYEYDVNSLVRAFYPGVNVTILTPESTEQRRKQTQDEEKTCEAAKEQVYHWDITLADNGAKVRLLPSEGAAKTMPTEAAYRSATAQEFVWEYVAEGFPPKAEKPDEDKEKQGNLDYKHGFKRFLYGVLCEVTGRTLPWGSLIGIRPTKIAYSMLEQGSSDAEILDTFTGIYSVSQEKAALGLDIAKREREILKDVHYEAGYSLYVGILSDPLSVLFVYVLSHCGTQKAGGSLYRLPDQRDGLRGRAACGQSGGQHLYRRGHAYHIGAGAARQADHSAEGAF